MLFQPHYRSCAHPSGFGLGAMGTRKRHWDGAFRSTGLAALPDAATAQGARAPWRWYWRPPVCGVATVSAISHARRRNKASHLSNHRLTRRQKRRNSQSPDSWSVDTSCSRIPTRRPTTWRRNSSIICCSSGPGQLRRHPGRGDTRTHVGATTSRRRPWYACAWVERIRHPFAHPHTCPERISECFTARIRQTP